MNTDVRVRLIPGGPWHRGTMTQYAAPRDPVVAVVVEGRPRDPDEVVCVRVFSSCPIQLPDAAVEAGFYVEGQPMETKR